MTSINDISAAISDAVRQEEAGLIAVRRDLHAHPELAFQEQRTAGVVARELGRLASSIAPASAAPAWSSRSRRTARPTPGDSWRHGRVADRGADGFVLRSENPGLMHACGHDVHTSTLLGVAAALKRLAPTMAAAFRLPVSAAEEILGGAQAMIDDGVLEGVDMALGFHNHPDIPVGQFGAVQGATYAACDRFRLVVRGVSGHAAYPQVAVDPIVAAAHFITSIQTIVLSREMGALEPCVVTVGAIHAGTCIISSPTVVSCSARCGHCRTVSGRGPRPPSSALPRAWKRASARRAMCIGCMACRPL